MQAASARANPARKLVYPKRAVSRSFYTNFFGTLVSFKKGVVKGFVFTVRVRRPAHTGARGAGVDKNWARTMYLLNAPD